MATVFTKIIAGDLPAHFVWRDARAVGFMSIAPLAAGHVLVVPRLEVDHWLDLDTSLMQHLTYVAQGIGKAAQDALQPARIGLMIAGLEVPHVHIHVVPINGVHDLDFSNADSGASQEQLAAAAGKLRESLRSLHYSEASD